MSMLQQARVKHPQFTEKDWKDLGYCDGLQFPDLTNNVHPIFAKRSDDGIHRFEGSDKDYETILPALRLASNYLYSPRACKLIYSIVYGDRMPVPITGFGPIYEFYEIDPILYSNDKMNRIWDQIARHSGFGPCRVDIGLELAIAHDIGDDGADLKGNGFRGRALMIGYNPKWIDDINNLHATGRSQSMEMLSILFDLAMTFTHEVAHAVNLSNTQKLPGLTPEPFFKDQMTAELGNSLVNEILGGVTDGWKFGQQPAEVLSICEWPDGYIPQVFPQPHRGPTGHPIEKFLLDMKFVQKIFQQKFWDSWAKLPNDEEKSKQLRIPKALGFSWETGKHPDWFIELVYTKEDRDALRERESRRIVREPMV